MAAHPASSKMAEDAEMRSKPAKKEKKRKDLLKTADNQEETSKKVSEDALRSETKAEVSKTSKKSSKVGEKRKAESSIDRPDFVKQRKGKKQDKSSQSTQDDDTAAAAPPKKKKKKSRDGQQPAAAPRTFAQVGDQDLAAQGLPIVKSLYTQHDEVTQMSAEEVAAFRKERAITVQGTAVKPVIQFNQLGLDKLLLQAVRTFKQPSPIQAQCWPIILQGWDLIGIASTGSGKTLAFGLPALRHITEQREKGVVEGKGPFMLCMAPTRELACQISEVLTDAGSMCGIGALTIYGGVPKRDQISTLRKGVEIAVGTPGRVCDLMQEGALNLSEVTYLVLDEADRMLDLGFEPEIRKIASSIRADRQTLMFSATWPTEIQRLAMEFLVKPVKVTIGSEDLAASDSVTQTVEVVEDWERNPKLLSLLDKHHKSRRNRILIFVLYKKEAPRIEQVLSRKGWKAVAIHGDMSQSARTQAVDDFKSGATPLLIATDVAARGLDIPDVAMVINYSFPLTVEDYVHRIGRTGRAGKTGIAHTFFVGANDKVRAGELVNVLREAGAEIPAKLMTFGTGVKKKESKLYGSHFKEVDMNEKATKIKFGDDSDDE